MTPTQLIAWRAQNNMSQQALAEHLKCAVRTVARYEKGVSPIPADLQPRLTSMANTEPVDTDPIITPGSHPHLYTPPKKGGYERRPEHPGYGKGFQYRARVSELATYKAPDPFAKPSFGEQLQAMVDDED